MAQPKFPCRLHVVLARESSRGIVIRRGPSKQVCSIGWDRKDDSFTTGQWLKGTIYALRCDISPDGKDWVYFAMKGGVDAYTVLARWPWLKAVGFWPQTGTWFGGGLFMDGKTLWINGGPGGRKGFKGKMPYKYPGVHPVDDWASTECLGAYFPRLLYSGWTHAGDEDRSKSHGITLWDKPMREGWTLQKRIHATVNHPPGKGCYYEEHRLRHAGVDEVLFRPAWEWADYDGKRLFWASEGKLHTGFPKRDGSLDGNVLKDFNPMKFQRLQAPYPGVPR